MKRLVKINKPLKNHKVGDIVKIEFKGDKPTDFYWQRRFEDAKIDKCVELIPKSKK